MTLRIVLIDCFLFFFLFFSSGGGVHKSKNTDEFPLFYGAKMMYFNTKDPKPYWPSFLKTNIFDPMHP